MESAIGLAKVRFSSLKRGSPRAVRHRLVLQRALAALVAHRAVERVVDQQQLHHAALGLLGDGGGQLGPHDHALRADGSARRGRLGLALDLHEALAASAYRVKQRVVAEPRDLDAELLGGPDDQRALRNHDLESVDRHPHAVAGLGYLGHRGGLPPEEGGGGRVEGAAAVLGVLDVLVPEVLDR